MFSGLQCREMAKIDQNKRINERKRKLDSKVNQEGVKTEDLDQEERCRGPEKAPLLILALEMQDKGGRRDHIWIKGPASS